MKLRAFQMEVVPGQPLINRDTMLAAITLAKHDQVDVLAFPEMAIPGYLLSDEWERSSFLNECEKCGDAIREAAIGITIIFGNVGLDRQQRNEDGRVRKYNACFVAENQKFIRHRATGLPFYIKFLMPNYREFDDNRYFHDPRKLAYEKSLKWEEMIEPVATVHGELGCFICEDGWTDDYSISPLDILCKKKAIILINISCSPYTYDKKQKRYRVFSQHARNHQIPLVYVNAVGLQDNGKTLFTFDGSSCIYDAQGQLLAEAKAFQEIGLNFNLVTDSAANHPIPVLQKDGPQQQYETIVYATKRFLERCGIKKIVIGVSGGIDSAVVAALYRQVLPRESLLLVNMPGPFTSQTTRSLAKQLATNLDAYYAEFPIGDTAEQTRKQVQNCQFANGAAEISLAVSDFVFENIQARDRSSRILAAIAASFGGAFTCNANKSEMTVGYSTLYGDLGGCLASIADLWKGEVYALADWINENIYHGKGIPQKTIDIVPSAELSAQQNVDSGCGDPLIYPYHDALFSSWVERWNRATSEDNLRWYLDGTLETELGYAGDISQLFPNAQAFIADLERWWNLYQGMAVAKRIQAPPIVALKRRAFGYDHRESQLGPRYSSTYMQLKKSLNID